MSFRVQGKRLSQMNIYDKYVLPKLVHFTCGQKPTMRQREKVVPLAQGRVLEIGIGSGLNIPFYDAQKVEHLWGLDPSAEMWSIAQKNAADHHIDAEFIQSGAESIPLDNNSADTVLMTYTMCTIPHPHTCGKGRIIIRILRRRRKHHPRRHRDHLLLHLLVHGIVSER
mgnify:CR=1 FL=1